MGRLLKDEVVEKALSQIESGRPLAPSLQYASDPNRLSRTVIKDRKPKAFLVSYSIS